jgi:hypothetical protein
MRHSHYHYYNSGLDSFHVAEMVDAAESPALNLAPGCLRYFLVLSGPDFCFLFPLVWPAQCHLGIQMCLS